MGKFYRAGFEKQLTGSALGPVNCNSAAGAMLVDQFTLGLKNPSPDRFRKLSGDTAGGMPIQTVGETLERFGVKHTVYDENDGYHFDDLVADLKRGKFAVVNGDYDVVPSGLEGSKTFGGPHSEFWHRVTPDGSGIVVGDPLCDGRRPVYPNGYVVYPLSVARRFVRKLDNQVPGDGIMCAVMDLQRLRAKGSLRVNVRRQPTRESESIGRIKGARSLVWGGTVRGERIGGNDVWYRVWFPKKSRIAYVHSSVVKTI